MAFQMRSDCFSLHFISPYEAFFRRTTNKNGSGIACLALAALMDILNTETREAQRISDIHTVWKLH